MPTKVSGSGKSEPAPAKPYRYADGELTLTLRVQPGASRTEWAGLYGHDALRLRLAAPAVDGRANRACIEFLAEALGVSKSKVKIVRGEISRRKIVRISQISPHQFRLLQQAWNS